MPLAFNGFFCLFHSRKPETGNDSSGYFERRLPFSGSRLLMGHLLLREALMKLARAVNQPQANYSEISWFSLRFFFPAETIVRIPAPLIISSTVQQIT